MFNSYTDDFKRNAVALVKAGYGIGPLASRLNIPPTSIRNWVGHPKYADVPPADKEMFSKVPDNQLGQQDLVLIGENPGFMNRNCLPELKIKIGHAELLIPKNTPVETFKILMQALRDSHVL